MSLTRTFRHELSQISKLTPARLARGIARYGAIPLRYGALPFRTSFERETFLLERSPVRGALDPLLAMEEMGASAWRGLARVGYSLVRKRRPKVIVELGTHIGLSALAMGLGLKRNGDGGRIFAVDTWQGDAHTGGYGETIHETFLRRVAELDLQGTVVPLRMLFDEARDQVPTPIDILHIDGLHTMDAVRHDFETFSPLVRPGGIVLFHDVRSQWLDVAEFWASLTPKYETALVPYSHGLGVLRMPTA